jgi:hypothetical protein
LALRGPVFLNLALDAVVGGMSAVPSAPIKRGKNMDQATWNSIVA